MSKEVHPGGEPCVMCGRAGRKPDGRGMLVCPHCDRICTAKGCRRCEFGEGHRGKGPRR